jgi:hypothetical protein
MFGLKNVATYMTYFTNINACMNSVGYVLSKLPKAAKSQPHNENQLSTISSMVIQEI